MDNIADGLNANIEYYFSKEPILNIIYFEFYALADEANFFKMNKSYSNGPLHPMCLFKKAIWSWKINHEQ